MKKIVYASMFAACLAILGTGCIKDKAYENHEYGLTNPADGPKGISFVQSANNPNIVGLDVSTNPQTAQTRITVEADQVAQTDITVTLQANNALLATVTDMDIEPLPAGVYTAPTLTITIPKGQRMATFAVQVNNTTTLDPNTVYGLGYTITSVSGGDYQIAGNNRNLIFGFNIKNAYDGLYKLNSQLVHPTATTAGSGTRSDIELRTYGPNSVLMFWRALDDYGHPIFPGNTGLSYFADQAPIITIDPSSNRVTSVTNYYPAGVAYAIDPSYPSRFVPDSAGTKWIFVKYGYSSNSRTFTDTLRYLGAR